MQSLLLIWKHKFYLVMDNVLSKLAPMSYEICKDLKKGAFENLLHIGFFQAPMEASSSLRTPTKPSIHRGFHKAPSIEGFF